MHFMYEKWSLILLSGVPWSGKTTFCKRFFTQNPEAILSSDEIRKRYFGEKYRFDEQWDLILGLYQWVNHEVRQILRILAKKRCELGITTIIDSTNLTDTHRQEFIKLGHWRKVYTILFDENKAVEQNQMRKARHESAYVPLLAMQEMMNMYDKTTSISDNTLLYAQDIESAEEKLPCVEIQAQRKILIFWNIHTHSDFPTLYHQLKTKHTKHSTPPLSIFLWNVFNIKESSLTTLAHIMQEVNVGNVLMINGPHETMLCNDIEICLNHPNIFEDNSDLVEKIHQLSYSLVTKHYPLHLGKIYEFLGKNFFTLVLSLSGQKKYILTHAPILYEENLGKTLQHEALHGEHELCHTPKESCDYHALQAHFLKAFQTLYLRHWVKSVCSHIDFDFPIPNWLIHLWGSQDPKLKVLVVSTDGENIFEEIEEFK